MPPLFNLDNAWAPLSLATILLLGILADAPRDSRRPLWRRLLLRVAVFGVLTWLLQRAVGSPVAPSPLLAPTAHVWADFVEIGWWALGARVAVGFLGLVVVLEGRPQETQIISDLLAGAIYTAAGLAVVNFVFGVPIGGLIATSGVIAIVLGTGLAKHAVGRVLGHRDGPGTCLQAGRHALGRRRYRGPGHPDELALDPDRDLAQQRGGDPEQRDRQVPPGKSQRADADAERQP